MIIKTYLIYTALLGVIMLNIKFFLFGALVLTFIYLYESLITEDKRVTKNREFNEYLDGEGRLN